MSYIDGHPHEIVGLLAGIPVYHPLADIPGPGPDWPEDDFGCRTDQLVIGGGPGEHPGLVLREIPAAVAQFVLACGDFELPNAVETQLSDICDVGSGLHFAGWTTEDHCGFFEICTSGALPRPLDPEGQENLERWLVLGVGEFVYYAMPELSQGVVELVAPFHQNAHYMRYNNILCVPPGIPVYANGGNAFFKP